MGFPSQATKASPKKTIPRTPTAPSCNGIICDAMSGAPNTTLELLHRDWRNMRPWRKARGERSWPSLEKARGREAQRLQEIKRWAGEASPSSPALLLLRCRQLASKNTRCCQAGLPARARKQRCMAFSSALHLCHRASLTSACPSPVSVPGR